MQSLSLREPDRLDIQRQVLSRPCYAYISDQPFEAGHSNGDLRLPALRLALGRMEASACTWVGRLRDHSLPNPQTVRFGAHAHRSDSHSPNRAWSVLKPSLAPAWLCCACIPALAPEGLGFRVCGLGLRLLPDCSDLLLPFSSQQALSIHIPDLQAELVPGWSCCARTAAQPPGSWCGRRCSLLASPCGNVKMYKSEEGLVASLDDLMLTQLVPGWSCCARTAAQPPGSWCGRRLHDHDT